ncbi:5'-nucleotidase [Paeniglutamicibacter gangotriensis Lz1y]|uniref:5'-nucleotidase n=2 Tax=Paeniglutamicibacter gangotriensis TaxID=254787 RepID=M7MT33_9MICC|nr:carbohydrate-binding protein [Paeniglutamicibacter gangotriensis]EMQ99577.1 5'-nucleotidase [Paeniglutamicibacter gangotriensis Lz1y]
MSNLTGGRRLSLIRVFIVAVVIAGLVGGGMYLWNTNRDSATAADTGRWYGSYVDATSTPFYPIAENVAQGQRVVLGFAVADPKDACVNSWGGYYSMDSANETFDLDRKVARVREQGGEIVISSGGLNNDELSTACTDEQKIIAGYESFLQRYDSTTLDLDVEGNDLEDSAASLRRASAVAALQTRAKDAGKPLEVWVTLPVDTRGLTESGLGEVKRLLEGGVDLAGVNLMTMNFGATRAAGDSMAAASEQGARSAHAQLKALYGQLGREMGDQTLWTKIGLTPMIGQNDLMGEVFTLDDAKALKDFAVTTGVGRISMWSANRDVDCGPNFPDLQRVSNNCSGTSQEDGAFASLLAADLDSSGVPAKANPSPVEAPVETAIVDDPAKSPYPVWNAEAAYPKSERIVWRGNVYEAKWWTQGESPDLPVSDVRAAAWKLIGPVLPGDKPEEPVKVPAGTYPAWTGGKVYEKGDRIVFDGRIFEAKWWNESQNPDAAVQGAVDSPWSRLSNEQVKNILKETKKTS